MKSLKAHLLICVSCTYKCKNGKDSDPDEAAKLRNNLKKRVKESFSKDEVRVTAVKCLGECDNGIASVLYPKGQWTLDLRPEDEDEIFKNLSDYVIRLR